MLKEKQRSSIGIATTTFYPTFGEGDPMSADNVRGNLAIATVTTAVQQGFQVRVVDGRSSNTFRQALLSNRINVQDEQERSMSGSRRQAIREVSNTPGVEVVVWVEPEKLSLVKEGIIVASQPIFDGQADIVVPQRSEDAFRTYPSYQTVYEKRANRIYNTLLKRAFPLYAEELDVWFGPRVLKNEPEVIDLFLAKYQFETKAQPHYQMVNPELWPNALFLPVIGGLHQGMRIKSVPVPYEHTAEQTAIERDSPIFEAKRKTQFRNILVSSAHYIHYLQGHPTRLSPVI